MNANSITMGSSAESPKMCNVMTDCQQRTITLIDRLKANRCELCGCENVMLEMHHVRKLKNLKGKEDWERIMIARRRKTIALCQSCHRKIHNGTID